MLGITVVPRKSWSGDLLIEFSPASKKPAPFQPGKKIGQILLLEKAASGKSGLKHEAVVSLGKKEKITADTFRQAGGATARWLSSQRVESAGLNIASVEALGVPGAREALVEGLILGDFRFDLHKSESKEPPAVEISLVTKRTDKDFEAEVEQANAVAQSVNTTREWAHEPPNVINPVTLARRAEQLAQDSGLTCKVLDEIAMAELGAGAILAVGMGSKTPPRMIVLEWPGKPKSKKAAPVVLVGKAITFDTGGYSLKSREGIVGMKFDKIGGMTVIGVLQAAAALELSTPLVGIVAAAENAISEKAYRPNDIVTAMSGKTIEIISTDAEGRLVLADALAYAQKEYKPRAMIDLATLTGGVVVSLGEVRAGLMSNDEALAQALIAAGEKTHERLWSLPLDDDYFEQIKGDDSDIKNSGGRAAQPVIGGIFLKQFVEDEVPWAHIDIAGTATSKTKKPYGPKGATGFGVRLLIEYLKGLEK